MDFSLLNRNIDSDWTTVLDQLIDLSISAKKNNIQADIAQLPNILFEFQEESPPRLSDLDVIAAKVAIELNGINRNEALRNMKDLSKELDVLSKELNPITASADQTSNELQLKNTKEFLTKAKTSLTILKGLRDDLSNEETDIGQKVSAIFKAIKDFEEAFPDA